MEQDLKNIGEKDFNDIVQMSGEACNICCFGIETEPKGDFQICDGFFSIMKND